MCWHCTPTQSFSSHHVLLLRQATWQHLQVLAYTKMWSHRLKAFKPSEKSIKKQLRLSGCCYVFWGTNTATHWICLWISVLGCLSDEVMSVSTSRMGFSVRTIHLISSEVTRLGSTAHEVRFCFPREGQISDWVTPSPVIGGVCWCS